ncbi:unknown [Rickettsia felis URRWXCal2]|uniref:Uncharacterized protein n=2 Tax=Rickettsia felis TaxID=42862 RepID=Q4UJY5_RICFE|nr:unknown [Rickettsia felis URRWXCal2]
MSKLVAVTTSAKVETPDKSRVLPDLIKILPPDLAAPSKVVFKVSVSVKLPVPVYVTWLAPKVSVVPLPVILLLKARLLPKLIVALLAAKLVAVTFLAKLVIEALAKVTAPVLVNISAKLVVSPSVAAPFALTLLAKFVVPAVVISPTELAAVPTTPLTLPPFVKFNFRA